VGDKQALHWLTEWYAAHCDGKWEHGYGVIIDTIDNPGWHIKIDLTNTELEAIPFEQRQHNYGDDMSWWICSKKDQAFEAYCGPLELISVINVFREWAEKLGSPATR
jgi:hypothetical protein